MLIFNDMCMKYLILSELIVKFVDRIIALFERFMNVLDISFLLSSTERILKPLFYYEKL